MKQGIDSLGVEIGFSPPNNRKFAKEIYWLIDKIKHNI